jgi:glucosamine-6-phosphate deaminase
VDIKVFPGHEDAAIAVARRIADAVQVQPDIVLGLPAGQTPTAVYLELHRLNHAGVLDFSRVTCFNLDEFVGLANGDRGSFRSFMTEHLYARVNVDPSRTHALDGGAVDPDRECERYEAAIAAAGGIDLQLLGLGRNGHIGFNEPADGLIARTHRVALLAETRRDNAARFGGDVECVPREALSMGVGTILRARAIVMMATGAAKARPVAEMIRGPVTPRMPASFLQLHGQVDVFLDRAAAARLPPA